jgi:hypothetical protein
MSNPDASADLRPAEANLGQALVLINRVLPRLDEPARVAEVQAALRRAAEFVESARRAHERDFAPRVAVAGPQPVATSIRPEIAAVIAAAIAVTFDRPHRLVSVQPVQTPVPYLNVWALEGRTQIFQSHKIR